MSSYFGNREDYPQLQATVSDAGGAALTLDVVDRFIAYYKSPEYHEDLERARQFAEDQHRAAWQRMERGWLMLHGAAEMTPELREGLDDAIWRFLVEHTNILEVLS